MNEDTFLSVSTFIGTSIILWTISFYLNKNLLLFMVRGSLSHDHKCSNSNRGCP